MSAPYHFGNVEVRPAERQVLVAGEPASIGARAFDVLLALIERRERVVGKQELLDVVWSGLVVEENNLQVQVSTLRKLLGAGSIVTVAGRGYHFTLAESPSIAQPLPTGTAATNIPWDREALVGRDHDVEEIGRLISEHRLVSVVGTGGIGKTSVAYVVARNAVGNHVDGVWWIDLTTVKDTSRMAFSIANAVNLQLNEGEALDSLIRQLGPRSMMIVLDNCEHLLAEAARIVTRLLKRAPALRLLATSREPLRVLAETVYRLEPLAVPATGASFQDARSCSAFQLLEQEARSADQRFQVDAADLDPAIAICRHLEGIPLALQMVGTRLPSLGVEGVASRLSDQLRLLRSDSVGPPERHQTMRATLDWSFSLLDSDERAVLSRLSVFVGTFDLQAAQRVAVGLTLDEWQAADAISGLVDKSLIQVDVPGVARYRLLESTRAYASEQLARTGETVSVQNRHVFAMAKVAEEAETAYWTSADAPWLDRYLPAYEDFRLALERSVEANDAGTGAILLTILERLDDTRSISSSTLERKKVAYALLSHARSSLDRALLWSCVSGFSHITISVVTRIEAASATVQAWQEVGDQRWLYLSLAQLAHVLAIAGDLPGAEDALKRAYAIEDPTWPPRLLICGVSRDGFVAQRAGDAARYRRCNESVLALAQRCGAEELAAVAYLCIGDAALIAGEVEDAVDKGRQAIDLFRALNRRLHLGDKGLPLSIALHNLAGAYLMCGELQRAREHLREALTIAFSHDIGQGQFDTLAMYAASVGRLAEAAKLLGASDAFFERTQNRREPAETRFERRAVELLEQSLSAVEVAHLRESGRHLDVHAVWSLQATVLGTEEATTVALERVVPFNSNSVKAPHD